MAARGPRRAAVFSSWACSFIAARSSAVNPSDDFLPAAAVPLADFCVSFMAASLPLRVLVGMISMLGNRRGGGFFKLTGRHAA